MNEALQDFEKCNDFTTLRCRGHVCKCCVVYNWCADNCFRIAQGERERFRFWNERIKRLRVVECGIL
jgi:hypothetical protein